MSFSAALYEGDSVIHSVPSLNLPAIPGKRTSANPATIMEIEELAVPEMKGWEFLVEILGKAFRSLEDWLERKAIDSEYHKVERYLSQSSNLGDLENRIRDLERRKQMNWIDCSIR